MKKLSILILCLVLLVGMVPFASAYSLPKIVDAANVLSNEQEEMLAQKAEQIAQKYGMDVVIVIVDSLGYKTAEQYADDYFDNKGYGIGTKFSGTLFLLSMEYRDWAISTCGDSIYALTDYGIELLFESCKDQLSKNNYYKAFDIYLDQIDGFYKAYKDGNPIDGYHDSDVDDYIIYDPNDSDGVVHYKEKPTARDMIRMVVVSLLIGLAIGGVTLYSLRSNMNTFAPQSNATSYIPFGGYRLTVRKDTHLYSNVSKIPRQTSSSSSSYSYSRSRHRGGGSSVHRSSSGRRHGGRSGKF